MVGMFEKIEIKWLTDVDMLLMVEKRIRRGICNAIHHYLQAYEQFSVQIDYGKSSEAHRH